MDDNHKDERVTQVERVRQSSRRRREQDKQELREMILQAAGEVFLERGYEDFSMRQVAERIGYSATTIYLYFENKDDLLFSVVDQGFERFSAQLLAAFQSTEDPAERLTAIGRAYLRFGLNNPMHYEMMFMRRTDFLFAQREGESQPRVSSFDVLLQATQSALDAGLLPPGDALAYSVMFWANTHGIVSMTITMPEHFTHDQAWQVFEAFMRLL